MRKTLNLTIQFFLLISIFALNVGFVQAADTARITVSPSSGTHTVGEEFTVNVLANGGGQNMSLFAASVSTSNLTVVSFSSSVCQKSGYLCMVTPSRNSLNFNAAKTGSAGISSLTVYTLKVKGKTAGSASINVSGGSVMNTVPAEILGSASGATFVISAASADETSETDEDSNVESPGESEGTTTDETTSSGQIAKEAKITNALESANTQSALEVEWSKIDINKKFEILNVSLDSTGKSDTKKKTLSGVKFEGSSDPGSVVTLYIFSTKIVKTATADKSGKWKIVVSEELGNGAHSAYGVSTLAGKTTRSSSVFNFTVDGNAGTVSADKEKEVALNTNEDEILAPVEENAEEEAKFPTVFFILIFIFLIVGSITGLLFLKKKGIIS